MGQVPGRQLRICQTNGLSIKDLETDTIIYWLALLAQSHERRDVMTVRGIPSIADCQIAERLVLTALNWIALRRINAAVVPCKKVLDSGVSLFRMVLGRIFATRRRIWEHAHRCKLFIRSSERVSVWIFIRRPGRLNRTKQMIVVSEIIMPRVCSCKAFDLVPDVRCHRGLIKS